MARRLGNALALSAEERTFLELLALRETSPGESERELVTMSLQVLATRHRRRRVSLRDMSALSDWYAVAILEMFDLENFTVSSTEIAKRLGGKVPPRKIRSTLVKLSRVGLVQQDETGRWKRSYSDALSGDEGVPSKVLRDHHRAMSQLAMQAMDKEGIEGRDIRSSTFAIRSEDYERAVEIIKEFHTRIRQLTRPGECDDVYYVGTQFFSLTHGLHN